MKSNSYELMKRGWVNEDFIKNFLKFKQENLLILLKSHNPCERSAAAFLLGYNCDVNEKIIYTSLIKSLCSESALYTKIEISKVLQKGNGDVATYMIDFLGRIGKNQHKKLPNKTSKKKSYPLPRDIIARILGKMDKSNFDVLLFSLNSCNEKQVSELLDSIGFMVFYNRVI
jgi:hypothetical protein